MANRGENKSINNGQEEEINSLRQHFHDKIRILSSIGQFSYILKIRADQYDVSLTLQLDESYPSKAPEIIITAPRLTPDQVSLVQRHLQTYSDTLINQPMVLQIYTRLLKWFDENNIQALDGNSNTTTPAAPRSPPNGKTTSIPVQASKHDEHDHAKKSSMKTAEDVIARIEWDEKLDSRYFRVGYIDRFLGTQEKPFNDFDFKVDLSTISDRHSNVLAIPKHRIQYFKYNSEIVWDKETRTDLMFGSTGNQETIYDVVRRHESLMDSNHSPLISQDNNTNTEQEIDDEHIPSARYLSLTDGAYKPNYYLSIPMTDPEIIKNYNCYQNHLLTTYSSLFSARSTSSDSAHLHLTLLTLHLETPSDIEQCVMLLKRLQEEIRYHCSYPDRLCLEFDGIETFYDRVVFVKCQQNRRLENLRTLIVERFREQQEKQQTNGIKLAGNYAEFIPHLTVLKCKRKFSLVCAQETKKDLSFGKQSVDCLQLSAIGKNETNPQTPPYTFKLDLS